jgi:hypothetical protein
VFFVSLLLSICPATRTCISQQHPQCWGGDGPW